MTVRVEVAAAEPLLQLANQLDWAQLAQLALPDLQQTAKGCWWRGRKLQVRTHLGVLVLQNLLKATDRGLEQQIRQTPIPSLLRLRGGAGLEVSGPYQDDDLSQPLESSHAPTAGRGSLIVIVI
jgi:hypothetical protein